MRIKKLLAIVREKGKRVNNARLAEQKLRKGIYYDMLTHLLLLSLYLSDVETIHISLGIRNVLGPQIGKSEAVTA